MSTTFPGLEAVNVSVEGPIPIAAETDLDERIRAFTPTEGWVAYQSAVQVLDGGTPPPCVDPEAGALLTAELVSGTATLTIRHRASPTGRAWLVTRIEEGGEMECWFDGYTYLSVDHGHMTYRRYWRQMSDGLRPFTCRFTGFGGAS